LYIKFVKILIRINKKGSSMSDTELEVELKELELIAPRVTPDQIELLMTQVQYDVHIVEGTTTTVVTAIAGIGFTLCTAIMACASPENFNAAIGAKYGIKKCKALAREELWKLEGYRLKCKLVGKE
jgi:hypothetical protein